MADNPEYAAEKKHLKTFIPKINVKSIGSSKVKKGKHVYAPTLNETEHEVEEYNKYLGFMY